jgi:hypothetical protein
VCESRRNGVSPLIVLLLELCRRDIADRLEQAPVVEPIESKGLLHSAIEIV